MNNVPIKELIVESVSNILSKVNYNELKATEIKKLFCSTIKKINNHEVKVKIEDIKIHKINGKSSCYTVFTINNKTAFVYFVVDKHKNGNYNEKLLRCHALISEMEKAAKLSINQSIGFYYLVFSSDNEATRKRPHHRENAKVYMEELRLIDQSLLDADSYKLQDKNEDIRGKVTLENCYDVKWYDIKGNDYCKFTIFEIEA